MERTPAAEAAIINALSPESVRDYLSKRAATPRFFDPVSKEAEMELLSRGDRLIDLSLAEYCLHPETAQTIFKRNHDDFPIRSLVLSNEAVSKTGFSRHFPEVIFSSEEDLYEYLSRINSNERAILFSNPCIDDDFLEDFLSLGKPWQVMAPDERLWALQNLARNEKLRRKRTTADHEDGWDWFMAGKPFEAAWLLITRLEPSPDTAKHLGALLRDLPADSYNIEGIAECLAKWKTPDAEKHQERKDNGKGRLSDFQTVRQAAARLLASRYDSPANLFMDSDDVALRCGAYEAAQKPNVDIVKKTIEADRRLARLHWVRNEALWSSKEGFETITRHVLNGPECHEVDYEFRSRMRKYQTQPPVWFDKLDLEEANDRTLSEITTNDLATAIRIEEYHSAIIARLMAVEKRQTLLLWGLALAFLVLIARA